MSNWRNKVGISLFGTKESAIEPINPLVAGCSVAGFLLLLAGKLSGPANEVAFCLSAGIVLLKLLARWHHRVSLFHIGSESTVVLSGKQVSEFSSFVLGSGKKKGP